MGKLLVLNVVVVVFVVYASALYTFKSADGNRVDEEIETIVRALDALNAEDKRNYGVNDEEDQDIDCLEYCDKDCNCKTDACEEVCLALSGTSSKKTRGTGGVLKKNLRRSRSVRRDTTTQFSTSSSMSTKSAFKEEEEDGPTGNVLPDFKRQF